MSYTRASSYDTFLNRDPELKHSVRQWMPPNLSSPNQLLTYPKRSTKPFTPRYLMVAEHMRLPKCGRVYERLSLMKTDNREMLSWSLVRGVSQGPINVVHKLLVKKVLRWTRCYHW